MGAKGLIDTSAMIALLDRDERWHSRCVEAFTAMRLPLATSAAVLAEFFHLLGDNPRDIDVAWTFLRSGAVTVLPIVDTDMVALNSLMKQYSDRPMDFADATLVHLVRRESLVTILTLDHNDFETYRIHGRQRFRIKPSH
jgi:predicted nucleic acid-binding protein